MEDKTILQNSRMEAVSGGTEEIIISNNPTPPPTGLNRNCPACGSSDYTRVKINSYTCEYTCNNCGKVYQLLY